MQLLQDYFLNNAKERVTDGGLSINGSDLLRHGVVIVKRSDPENFFIARNINDVDLNDKILEILYKNNKNFSRVGNITTELSQNALIAALEKGDYVKAKQLAPLHDVVLDSTTIETMKEAKLEADKADAEAKLIIEEAKKKAEEAILQATAKVEEAKKAASSIIASIKNTFTEREIEAERKSREEVEAKRTEKEKAILAAWDSGEGSRYNTAVTNANAGSPRLRTKTSRSGSKRMETSTDYQISYRTALRAWKLAASLWFHDIRLNSFTAGTYTVIAENNRVRVGCQSVVKSEILRYAEAEGWPKDIESIDELIALHPGRR